MLFKKIYSRIKYLPWIILALYYKCNYGSFSIKSRIIKPLRVDGKKNIYIMDNVIVQSYTWLASLPLTGDRSQLRIGRGCVIGHFNHIFATKSIIFHKNVLTADKVYISDNLHGYEDVETPIKDQPIVQNRTVEIGEGSWLGENVCVLGAHIGKHCIIGANSVVTKDIPDFCIAVGAPARVVKRFDFEQNIWVRV